MHSVWLFSTREIVPVPVLNYQWTDFGSSVAQRRRRIRRNPCTILINEQFLAGRNGLQNEPCAIVHINEKPLSVCVCVRLCVSLFVWIHGVPEMELRHRAHAAANRGSAVFKQWTTGSLSFPLTALSHSSFLNHFYSFLTFCSQSFSIISTLCSFSFYSGAFSLHPSPMLQFPVNSDNECMVLLPCSHFLCELHAAMPSQ